MLHTNQSKKSFKPSNDNPGPGAYQTQAERFYRKPPIAVMGTAHRPDPAKQVVDTPGPCMYLPSVETVKKRNANWTLNT